MLFELYINYRFLLTMCENQPRPSKKFKSSISLNSVYDEEKNKIKLKEEILGKNNSMILDGGIEIVKNPFTCTILSNFISNSEFLENLKESLYSLDFAEKNNDLYKFHQSNDLKKSKDPHIVALRELLYGSFLGWLREVTGIDLDDTIDMSCARYESTDILLCHDDQLESRKIAYIYYLVPPNWQAEDGGTLDLFSTENRHPGDIVKSLVPKWNNFVFFEVSTISFHQVAEIITDEKCRLSISGWFHSSVKNKEIITKPDVSCLSELYEPDFVEENIVYSWINPTYLKEEIQMEIQEKFEEESEIQLVDFFMEDKFLELNECLKNTNLTWHRKGPVNHRNFCELDLKEPTLPSILRECLELLKSEAMFLILSNLTGLSLHPLMAEQKEHAENVKSSEGAKCKMAVQQWKHGSYSLLADSPAENEKAGLDLKCFFNAGDWKMSYGGFTSYVAKGEDEELLTVSPVDNTLSLVYRDKETLSFVKHINHLCLERGPHPFYDIQFIYYE